MKASRVLSPPSIPEEDTFYFVKQGSSQIGTMVAGNATDLVDLNRPPPTLKGPVVAYYNGYPFDYVITNYDQNSPYALSSTTGTLTRTGNIVSYTPFLPINESRYDSFYVNGRQFVISVLVEELLAPQIIHPPEQSENITANTMVVEASEFNSGNPETKDSHLSSDWEVATDPEFTNIVASSYNDSVNLTTWDPNV